MRAVIVATGDLDSLPGEVQSVANTLSGAGWTVRLCIGADASRAGLLAAAGEGATPARTFVARWTVERYRTVAA